MLYPAYTRYHIITMQYLKNLPITSKFILWFLFISLIPLGIAAYISYDMSRHMLIDEVQRGLIAIADNKANQIEAYFKRVKKDAASLPFMSGMIEAVEKLHAAFHANGPATSEYAVVEQELKPILTYYQKNFGCEDIILIDAEGNVLLTTAGTMKFKSVYELVAFKKDSELATVFNKSRTSQDVESSTFEYSPDTNTLMLSIAMPVFKAGQMIGCIIIQMTSEGLFEFAQDYTGLQGTGETVIAARIGTDAVFLTPTRFDTKAAFTRRVKMGALEGACLQNALKGERGSALSLDYRGVEVLSVWRYLPTFQLGLVVKMNTKEVYRSAALLRDKLLKISLLLLALVVIAAVIIAATVSVPIKELTRTSSTIATGDLTARARVHAADEIGVLAYSFNQMTDKLVEAKANVEEKNRELEKQKLLLEEANKELDSFVYTVSHDLRAPLRGIDGFASFLEHDYAKTLDAQGKEFIKRIRSGTDRMKTLIDDLLTLSRISRIKNPYEDVDMNDLVRSVVARVEFDINQKKVDLVIAPRLPIVRCDRIKTGEVFLNLITNAIKFSSKMGDVRPRVEIGYHDRPDAHEFFVKDNGIGIDQKYHREIFGIFKRLHKQEEYEGTGAGLAIVKRIIDDHKASIWIDSAPGKGATFFFSIPKHLEGPAAAEGTGALSDEQEDIDR